jgi:cellulose synthase/poly-beta-1,6-N-acetylglucosamine synthase-like glycosyltransferase
MLECAHEMREKPFISIIIPVRNGQRVLGRCLESIKKQTYPSGQYEIIISDGMSTDDTVKIARDFGATVVKNPKITVGPGRNEGFSAARGELIAFSDDDCVMDRNWLFNSVKYFNDERVGGLSGPTITQSDVGPLSDAIGLMFELAAGIGVSAHRSDHKQAEEVEDIPGCNAIYRREALEKIFPIDETLITAEDVEMNRLIRRAGLKLLYVPDVRLWHCRRQSISGVFKQIYRFAVGRLQVGRRDKSMLKLTHILVGLTLPLFVVSLLAFYLLHIRSLYIYAGLIASLIVVSSIYGLFKTGSIRAAMFFPLVVMTAIIAWSFGFMRELIFPSERNFRAERSAS